MIIIIIIIIMIMIIIIMIIIIIMLCIFLIIIDHMWKTIRMLYCVTRHDVLTCNCVMMRRRCQKNDKP